MGLWNMRRSEPSLDELLADEMMGVVTRSAGTDPEGLRDMLRQLASRLPADQFGAVTPRCAREAACCQPSGA